MKLRIAEHLTLGADFVTSTQAILAQKGKGKSYTAAVEAEELLEAGQLVVIVDPTDAHYGLRSSPDGRSTGYPIAVFGGDHGDVQLEPGGGAVLAEAIVRERFSAIVCTETMSKAEELRFIGDFLETLYRKNREAMHLFLDEADIFAPQNPFGGEMKTCGAADDIVRRGRKKGIGCTLITQRASVLNKNVLSQADMLVALGCSHPLDLDAIDKWVRRNADAKLATEMMASLPSLPRGDAWAWNPSANLFKRVTIRQRHTFDSGATPKAGEKKREPKILAPVDIERLGKSMAEAVQRQRDNDPKELKRKLAELTKKCDQLARAKQAPAPAPGKTVTVEKPVVKDAQLARIEKLMERAEKQADRFDAIVEGELSKLDTSVMGVRQELAKLRDQLATLKAPVLTPAPSATIRSLARAADTLGGRIDIKLEPPNRVVRGPQLKLPAVNGHGDAKLPIGEAKTLTALIQYPNGLRRTQLTVLTGYARSSRDAYISRLKARGFVHDHAYGVIVTDAGRRALPDAAPLPSGPELRAWWERELPEGERRVLAVLCEQYPNRVMRTAIDEITKYQRSSRDAYLSRLKAKELIEDVGRGEVKASDTLFEVA